VTDLVVLPLYPQFSISTSGSSLRLLQQMFEADPELDGLRHCVIASWRALFLVAGRPLRHQAFPCECLVIF
jgi:protoheme ferro-lyase